MSAVFASVLVLWPAVREGNISLPGRERLGAWRATEPPMPPSESFRAITPTGLAAGRVATLTITLALNTY